MSNEMIGKGTVAIDFDGVIHKYSRGYQNGNIYDKPMEGAFEAIGFFLKKGYSVYIHSTRDPEKIKKWMEKKSGNIFWSSFYGFCLKYETIPFYWHWFNTFWNKKGVVGITNRKIPAKIYIDDRAYRFTDWEKDLPEIIKIIKHNG